MLKKNFLSLVGKYTGDDQLKMELWKELEERYTDTNRHYHTLDHLKNMLSELMKVKAKITDWDTLLFSLFYHDIIYSAIKSDNEERSAELAESILIQLGLPEDQIENCIQQILATKSHDGSNDSDTNYLVDADLSILGQDWEKYSEYFKNVRKEFFIYPDLIYKPGRKRVINHFLEMERIFKTEFFHKRYENQAKQNLKKELEYLSFSL